MAKFDYQYCYAIIRGHALTGARRGDSLDEVLEWTRSRLQGWRETRGGPVSRVDDDGEWAADTAIMYYERELARVSGGGISSARPTSPPCSPTR